MLQTETFDSFNKALNNIFSAGNDVPFYVTEKDISDNPEYYLRDGDVVMLMIEGHEIPCYYKDENYIPFSRGDADFLKSKEIKTIKSEYIVGIYDIDVRHLNEAFWYGSIDSQYLHPYWKRDTKKDAAHKKLRELEKQMKDLMAEIEKTKKECKD